MIVTKPAALVYWAEMKLVARPLATSVSAMRDNKPVVFFKITNKSLATAEAEFSLPAVEVIVTCAVSDVTSEDKNETLRSSLEGPDARAALILAQVMISSGLDWPVLD